MKTTKQNTPPSQQDEGREIHGAPDVYSVVTELWERAADRLSEKELEWFSGCSDNAEYVLSNIADSVARIGILIHNDDDDHTRCFDNASVGCLLYHLAESMRGVEALVSVGSCACSRLIHKDRYKK